ncbi:hypothetical protein EDF56_11197 [Novosphingobium sp. PhB165]|uniref:hypothetical protein n=1 Tax=Novosphingobium sp. PhB165 TaxID=2485105 RepID=UPI0010EFAAA2|nr:hypothetical protein [Novosphingobium sp. PhB165]TCM15050.1 hypothetical protein EDF56_11197 [Novosphingobium sp. PhB165]
MKANPRRLAAVPSFPRKLVASAPLTALALLAACVSAPQPPAPPPRPAPAPVTRPAPPPADWRDAPQTPGDWSMTAPGTATFAGGLFTMRCNRPAGTVTLIRAGNAASAPGSLTVRTSDVARALTATPVAGGLAVDVPARDALLDAMAFSKGRFAIETAGTATLYIPSWTEVSRVVEDCR